jgi:hypothetical protein
MQNREIFIILGVNTIIIILVLLVLFRMYDKKIKLYLKKIEKHCINKSVKIDEQKDKLYIETSNGISSQNINKQQNNQPIINDNNIIKNNNDNINHNENINNNDFENIMDGDSYIDPLRE